MLLTANLSSLPPAVREAIVKHLCHEDAAQLAIEKSEQAKVAKFYRDNIRPGQTFLDPRLGQRHSMIHVGLQNRLAAQHGHAVAWNDPEFRRWILKHDDSFRVPDVREKISSGWTPASEIRNPKSEIRNHYG